MAALRSRGVARLERVHFKQNRSRLLAVGRTGRDLHVHLCFATAPPEVLDALADWFRPRVPGPKRRSAVRLLREFAAARRSPLRPPPRPGRCIATAEQRSSLRDVFLRLNQERFGGKLPCELPLRLSGRMTRRLGHAHLGRRPDGTRYVVEIALNADLMHPSNEAARLDTLLHEMAHAAAWLWDGSRGHDALWRARARQAGCIPRACATHPIVRRR